MSSADVVKIDGAPGVGKSTRLFEYVAQERNQGTSLTDLYYLTFARSGVEESATRLAEQFPEADEEDVRKRAKTFHGAAWRACFGAGVFEDPDVQIIERGTDDDVYRDFCDEYGLRYVEENQNPLKAVQDGENIDGNGNRLFAISDYLTLTRKPNEKHSQAPVDIPLGHERVVRLLEGWDEFKKNHYDLRRFEHGDYVDEAIKYSHTPPASVLFIDEFQDLSPQEYLLFKTWRDNHHIDRIYIAGDPNQSIYSFRAGSPYYFERTDVDEDEVLKTSHRCPTEIAEVASGILKACPETDPQGFTSSRSGGTVEEHVIDNRTGLGEFVNEQIEAHEPTDSGEVVYLLTRANYQVYKLSAVLREYGIPFEWLGSRRGVWEEPMPTLLRALRKMHDEPGGVPVMAVKELTDHSPQTTRRRELLPESMGDVYDPEEVWQAFPDSDGVEDVIRSLDLYEYQRDLLEAATLADSNRSTERVKIGTIHGAKGLEAPSVVLFDAYTSQLEEAYYDGNVTAEEHRLYYVATTRASESLHLIRGFFDGPQVPFLEGELPRDTEEVTA